MLSILYLPKDSEWIEEDDGFTQRWQSHCLGAVDGKHAAITCPRNSGPTHRNYEALRLFINLCMGLKLKVDLLGAIQMISRTLADIKQDRMANCFRRAGFAIAAEEGFSEALDDNSSESLNDAFRQLSAFPDAMPVEVTARDFVSVDDEVQAGVELSETDIVADVGDTEEAESSGNEGPGDRRRSLHALPLK
ncbi:hypothetical protein HPB47_011751 [Ixodes persulcatus]|uniref:Uncharacterized protein n=1 Tax=Ixodes persulcatus TaxID=34615 RepID=A0AC60NVL4_IXOPE|nr:hypothetical protein HPB47_011751 [Ixodes persulcatus]